jgi:hypothetical protein
MFPFLFAIALLYFVVTLLICLATGFFCCFFSCGTTLEAPSDSKNTTGGIKSKFDPWRGIRHTVCVVLLPFISLFRDLGMSCSCFPQRLPGDDREAADIPVLVIAEKEKIARE